MMAENAGLQPTTSPLTLQVKTSSSSTAHVYSPEAVRTLLARPAGKRVVILSERHLAEMPVYQHSNPTGPRPGFRFLRRYYDGQEPCGDGMRERWSLMVCTIAADPEDPGFIYWFWARCYVRLANGAIADAVHHKESGNF